MTVKFKSSKEPCITYKVINKNPVTEYDEVLKKYCDCIEIESLGLVPQYLLEEVTGHDENVSATDIVVYLTNENEI